LSQGVGSLRKKTNGNPGDSWPNRLSQRMGTLNGSRTLPCGSESALSALCDHGAFLRRHQFTLNDGLDRVLRAGIEADSASGTCFLGEASTALLQGDGADRADVDAGATCGAALDIYPYG
jgi:hypothetical protein